MKKISLKNKCFVAITENICPVLSNYYYSKCKSQSKTGHKDLFSRCVFCCNRFSGDNYSVRITPKPALNNKIKRLLNRHDTDSSSLGKYQTKLINDYIHGRNTLNIICHACKKTRKVAGLSRDEKIKNDLCRREKLKLQGEVEVEKVPSKKEKKKEKKKLQRKRKAAGIDDDDVSAGLILPATTQPVLNSDDIDNRLKPILPEPVQEDMAINHSTCSNQSKTLYKTGLVKDISVNHKTFSQGVTQGNAKTVTQIQNKQTNQQSGCVGRLMSSSVTVPGVQKVGNKKQKSKKMSKQLGNILKQEQKKKTEGTLADFLSSL